MTHRLRLEYLALDDLEPATSNPKRHDLEALARSVDRFGYVEPVVVDERTGRLVAGHGRVEHLRAAREAGQSPPEGLQSDGDTWLVPVVRGWSSTSDADADAYLVASNRLTELGGWDNADLAALLGQMDATLRSVAGYTAVDLKALLRGQPGPDRPVEPYEVDGDAEIIHGSALALPLDDASVDLVVTSPPYFALRSYRDGDEHYDGQVGSEETPEAFLEALWAATAEMVRVLKPEGSIWVNLGDKYAGSSGGGGASPASTLGGGKRTLREAGGGTPDRSGIPPKSLMGLPWRYAIGCIDRLGLILRAEIIWAKPNGLPESVTDRVRRSHEHWFHFVTQARYFAAVDDIREPYLGEDNATSAPGPSGMNRGLMTGQRDEPVGNFARDPLGRVPGSVWSIATEPLVVPDNVQEHYRLPDHYAAFPQELPRRIILGWSPAAGRVLDPFGGTGTVAMVARALGRHGVSVDLSEDYCRLAEWRIFGSGHDRKVKPAG